MSFLTLPQNYAPGFAPQRYVYVNDTAAPQLTARLSDARTGETVASLPLYDLWAPELDVSCFLRRMAAVAPFDDGATGLYAPQERTMALAVAIRGEAAPARIFLPATRQTQAGEPLTVLPATRLIGDTEADEIAVQCRSDCMAELTVFADGSASTQSYEIAAQGIALFRLDATEFPGAESFELALAADGEMSTFRYEVAPPPPLSRRLAWLNDAGGIDRYTFPLVEERRYEIERNRLRLEEAGYVQSDATAEQRLRLGSAYEPAAVLEALAQLAAAPAVWAAANEGWMPVDVVSDTLSLERTGRLQHLSLEIRPCRKGGRL